MGMGNIGKNQLYWYCQVSTRALPSPYNIVWVLQTEQFQLYRYQLESADMYQYHYETDTPYRYKHQLEPAARCRYETDTPYLYR